MQATPNKQVEEGLPGGIDPLQASARLPGLKRLLSPRGLSAWTSKLNLTFAMLEGLCVVARLHLA